MSAGVRILRAYRPSRWTMREEFEEDNQSSREAMVALYRERAQAGLPLFEESMAVHSPLPQKHAG